MNRPSNKYWQNRFEILTESLLNKADRHYAELIQEYEKALLRIQREIEQFYAKFATDNKITLAEARRLLTAKELKEFHWTIEEFIEKAIESSLDQRWVKELNNASVRVRISRLESLEYQIRQQIELLSAKRLEGLTELSKNITEEGYYRTIYEIQKGFGVGDTFGILDTGLIESIITKPWAPDGSNFSSRIWKDKNLLMNELQKSLIQSFIRGEAPDKAIKHIVDTMNVSKKAAGRLIMTESAFFANEAREKAFRELGIEEYIFLATLDIKTSNICREMDSKVFKLSEKQVGVNWPPLHPNCRSTTAPYFEGNIKERWARDPVTGKGYRVENMSYKEWYEKYVSNNPEAILAEKKWKNRYADRKQYERYKKVLGMDLGVSSIDDFQNLKYNNTEKWEETQAYYRYKKKYPESNQEYFKINKDIQELISKGVVAEKIGVAVKPIPIDYEKMHKHALKRMAERNLKDQDIKGFIKDAKVMFKQDNDRRNVYYSEKGAAGIIVNEKMLITAFPASSYDEGAKAMMEVLKKHGK